MAVAGALMVAPPSSAAESAPDDGRAFEPRPRSEPLYGVSDPSYESGRQNTYVRGAGGTRIYLEWWLPSVAPGGPQAPAKVPVVLDPTPYYQPDLMCCYHQQLMKALVPRGYAFARVHIRGTGASDGCMEMHTRNEALDVAAAVDYLSDAKWSTGKVGAIGLSYDAMESLHAATRAPWRQVKALKAIVAAAPAAGARSYDGVPFWVLNAIGETSYHSYALSPSYGLFDIPGDPEGAVQARLRPGGNPTPDQLVQRHRCRPETAPDVFEPSGDITPYERERMLYPHVGRLRAATLMLHGLDDFGVMTIAQAGLFDRIPRGVEKAAVFGRWRHDYPWEQRSGEYRHWQRTHMLMEAIAWFDRHLKGHDLPRWPVVQIQDQEGQWRTERDWPATGGPAGQLALEGTTLGATSPRGSSLFLEGGDVKAGQRPAAGQYLEFRTPPLRERLVLTGMPVLDARIRVDRDDAHVGAVLEAFSGPETRIPEARAFAARSLRHLAPMTDGYFDQRRGLPVQAGKVYEVRLRFTPNEIAIPKGGHLRLSIAGSADPSRDGTTYADSERGPTMQSGAAATVELLHDCGAGASVLRFLMPSPESELLNVREHDEEGPLRSTPQRDNRPVDGGGLATGPVCGRGPVTLPEQEAVPARR